MNPFRILHLSDAHIGNSAWQSDQISVMRPLLDDIKTVSKGSPPNLIIFSGDLVYGDNDQEKMISQFSQARQWLQNLHETWGHNLGEIPILLVPGNHDVERAFVDEGQTNWLDAQTECENIEAKIHSRAIIWKRILERQEMWWNFIKEIPSQKWNHDESLRMTTGKIEWEGKAIGIVGYNTSWASCRNGEKGKLWLTRHQFNSGEQAIQNCDFRIAVLHHPISWLHESEEAWLSQRFESKFQIVMHGHLHNGWYTHNNNHTAISAGACWAGSKSENAYYWLDLTLGDNSSVELTARTYTDKGAGHWVAVQMPKKFNTYGTVQLLYGEKREPLEEAVAESSPELNIGGTFDIAQTGPISQELWISREDQIDHLKDTFDSSSRLVFLTGQDGVGKTVLAAQLAQNLQTCCISLFLESGPHWSTQLSRAKRDVSNQANWIISGNEISIDTPTTDQTFTASLTRLQRHSRAKRVPIYIIIDGLNKPARFSTPDAIADIFTLFEPFFSTFRFVITIIPELLPEKFRKVTYRTFPVPRFREEQTNEYLQGVVSQDLLPEMWKLTRGHPAALASIRRILKKDPATTIETLSANLPDLFNHEWNQVDEDNSSQILLLAAVSLFPQRFTKTTLTTVLNIPIPEVDFAIAELGFITACENTGEIQFISEALRAYAARKLQRFEASIRDSIISNLMKSPDDTEALQEVPMYLSESGRGKELMEYLSPDHLAKLLQKSQSWQQAIEKADLAFNAALASESVGDYSRFALHKSSLYQFQNTGSSRATLEALLSLGRIAAAIEFSEAQVTKEHRLLLLSIIARSAKQKGLLLVTSVSEEIQRLVDELPPQVATEQKLDIATELIHTYPELAIKIIENLSEKRETIDSALATVSIRAFADEKKDLLLEGSIDTINSKIGSEKVRGFTAAAHHIFGGNTAIEALKRIKQVSAPKDQIYLLRQWTGAHPKASDGKPLIEYALNLIIKTTEYTPSARGLQELAAPLPYLEKDYSVTKLATRFDEQLKLLRASGFTEDYVKLQLTLAHTEISYAEASFKDRLEKLYFYILEIEDLSVRVSCIALFCAKLLDKEFQIPEITSNNLYDTLISELNELYKLLLTTTADHYIATRDIIEHVNEFDPRLSFTLAQGLNTEPRRNHAFVDILLLEIEKDYPDLGLLKDVISECTNRSLLEHTILKCLYHLVEGPSKPKTQELTLLFDPLVTDFYETTVKVKATAKLLIMSKKNEMPTTPNLLSKMRESWEKIDDVINKREAGLDIVTSLADLLPSTAVEYWNEIQDISSKTGLTESNSLEIVFHNILLSIRFFKGLIRRGTASNSDRQVIFNLIEKLPSLSRRAVLLGELSIAYFQHNKRTEASSIVEDSILPLLEQIAQNDRGLYERTFVEVAPAIYLAHSTSARQRLQSFQPFLKDAALYEICSFLKNGISSNDPFPDDDRRDLKLSFNDLSELAGLVEDAEDDSFICWTLSSIACTIASPRGKRAYTQQQQTELATQMRKVVSEKLPNGRFVKHNGYSIVARAEISRFTGISNIDLELLLSEAREIDNISDRCFVLALVASSISGTRLQTSRDLIKESMDLVTKIPTYEDRVERYHMLSRIASEFEKSIAKDLLRQAIDQVGLVENWRGGAYVRRIVDAASKLDKNLAEEFSSKLDNDPARSDLKRIKDRQKEEETLREKICDGESLENLTDEQKEIVGKVISKIWGEINTGKHVGIKLARCGELIKFASRQPLRESLQTWNFLAVNLVKLYENTDQSESFLRPLFEAVVTNSELALRIARSTSQEFNQDAAATFDEFYSGIVNIPAGSRQRAIDEIGQWCSEFVEDYLIIADPSFQQRDLALVELIRRSKDCPVIILSSKSAQNISSSASSVEESYKKYWRELAGAQSPENIDIVLVGSGLTGELPISTRALLTKGAGLSMSSAFSQLGVSRNSTLQRLSPEDASHLENEATVFLDTRLVMGRNPPLSITKFTLF